MASYAELRQKYEQLKAEGKELSTSKSFAKIDTQLKNHPVYKMVKTIEKEIVELDRQLGELDNMGLLSLSDEEKETFLQKAIEEVQPYYDRKSAEIETQLQEGKLRTAEDILSTIRDVELETGQLFEQYDLSTAQTEEEFIDRISALTSQTEDELALKKDDWRQRIETTKMDQIQKGVFSSGIGAKERQLLDERKGMELETLQRRAGEEQTSLEREKKYNLEQISLARQAAEKRRIQQIGTSEERDRLTQENLGALGYSDMSQLPSEAGLMANRQARNVNPLYNKYALDDLEEERRTAIEGRKMELQSQNLAEGQTEYNAQREKILAERAKRASQLGKYY